MDGHRFCIFWPGVCLLALLWHLTCLRARRWGYECLRNLLGLVQAYMPRAMSPTPSQAAPTFEPFITHTALASSYVLHTSIAKCKLCVGREASGQPRTESPLPQRARCLVPCLTNIGTKSKITNSFLTQVIYVDSSASCSLICSDMQRTILTKSLEESVTLCMLRSYVS